MVVILLSLLFSTGIKAECLYSPPFEKGKSFRLLQGFNGKFSHHPPLQYGIDIDMPIGTLIYSARGGVVDSVEDKFDKGGPDPTLINQSNKIIIDHGDGSFALYAHLKKGSSRVKPGQKIKKGFPLGRSGCTGWCDGPHLHFEIFKKDNSLKRGRRSMPFKLGCQTPKLGSKITN